MWDVSDEEKRFKLHLNAVGIEESPITPIAIGESDIRIYAADGNIFIHALQHAARHNGVQYSGGTAQHAALTITDITGRIVLQQEIILSGLIAIPVNLQTGVYVVMVQSGQEVKTEKVFIK